MRSGYLSAQNVDFNFMRPVLTCGFPSEACLNQVTSTFLDGTQSFPGREQATTSHLKDFMTPNPQIFISENILVWPYYTFK